MWNLKCTIIPVVIGATGIVTRSLRKNLEPIPGKHSIDSLQKTAILGTSHIIWMYCSVKLEVYAVGITAGSREVPGIKGPWQETIIIMIIPNFSWTTLQFDTHLFSLYVTCLLHVLLLSKMEHVALNFFSYL
jgi:hypothetical protein